MSQSSEEGRLLPKGPSLGWLATASCHPSNTAPTPATAHPEPPWEDPPGRGRLLLADYLCPPTVLMLKPNPPGGGAFGMMGFGGGPEGRPRDGTGALEGGRQSSPSLTARTVEAAVCEATPRPGGTGDPNPCPVLTPPSSPQHPLHTWPAGSRLSTSSILHRKATFVLCRSLTASQPQPTPWHHPAAPAQPACPPSSMRAPATQAEDGSRKRLALGKQTPKQDHTVRLSPSWDAVQPVAQSLEQKGRRPRWGLTPWCEAD